MSERQDVTASEHGSSLAAAGLSPERECDVCGELRDDVTTFFYEPVGDTSACGKCRGTAE